MTCKNCGAVLKNGERVCPACGTPAEPKNVRSTPILIFGVLGAGLAFSGVFGLVFSLLALIRSRAFARETDGVLFGKAKAGKILAVVGIVLSAAALLAAGVLLALGLAGVELPVVPSSLFR